VLLDSSAYVSVSSPLAVGDIGGANVTLFGK
jgi:hypothetical protein